MPPAPIPVAKPSITRVALAALLSIGAVCPTFAADQTVPGAGNAVARRIAERSPLVQSSLRFLAAQAAHIKNEALRSASLDFLTNTKTCALHRRGLATPQAQDAVIEQLFAAGLISPADASAFAPGIRVAVFPPLALATGDCPQLPQPIGSAPGSAFGGHHSYPGGLPVHEANNDLSDVHLASQYRSTYGTTGRDGAPVVDGDLDNAPHLAPGGAGDLPIDDDVILAAPIWHDWAKTLVFQWNADGSEFAEFNFGGNGTSDAWGGAGDSRTGGHHILGIAESMARQFSPLMVITQASAHSAPTLGNEYKVVNWLRAAAIIARIDPVSAGYLVTDGTGRLRLPPLDQRGQVDLLTQGQTNLRVEYTLHNLSDADYTFSGPAIASANLILTHLAPEFGIDPTDVTAFNTRLRNPVLAHLSGERVQILCATKGLGAVRQELQRLRRMGII